MRCTEYERTLVVGHVTSDLKCACTIAIGDSIFSYLIPMQECRQESTERLAEMYGRILDTRCCTKYSNSIVARDRYQQCLKYIVIWLDCSNLEIDVRQVRRLYISASRSVDSCLHSCIGIRYRNTVTYRNDTGTSWLSFSLPSSPAPSKHSHSDQTRDVHLAWQRILWITGSVAVG